VASDTASIVQAAASVIALGLSGWALYYSHAANQQAKETARKQGDYVVIDNPSVTISEPSITVTISGPRPPNSAPTPITAGDWAASEPSRRYLDVNLRNEGQQEAHLLKQAWSRQTKAATTNPSTTQAHLPQYAPAVRHLGLHAPRAWRRKTH
jgi:hypothetical protein